MGVEVGRIEVGEGIGLRKGVAVGEIAPDGVGVAAGVTLVGVAVARLGGGAVGGGVPDVGVGGMGIGVVGVVGVAVPGPETGEGVGGTGFVTLLSRQASVRSTIAIAATRIPVPFRPLALILATSALIPEQVSDRRRYAGRERAFRATPEER